MICIVPTLRRGNAVPDAPASSTNLTGYAVPLMLPAVLIITDYKCIAMTNKTDVAQAWQRWSIANYVPTPERGNDKALKFFSCLS